MALSFDNMVTALQDALGITGTLSNADRNRLDRIVNRGKDRLVSAFKWPWLETSGNQLFTSGTRAYFAPAAAESIVALEDPSGNAIRRVERDTYDRIHRPSTATATVPQAYGLQGFSSTALQAFNVWPQPSTNTTGTIRYIARISDLSSANGTLEFDHIPNSHQFAVVKAAEIEHYEQTGDGQRAQLAEQQFMDMVTKLAGTNLQPLTEDGSEQ